MTVEQAETQLSVVVPIEEEEEYDNPKKIKSSGVRLGSLVGQEIIP
jgi:hypothetical protein